MSERLIITTSAIGVAHFFAFWTPDGWRLLRAYETPPTHGRWVALSDLWRYDVGAIDADEARLVALAPATSDPWA
jgi:hypothetical protein